MDHFALLKFYGVDWFALTSGFLSTWALGNKQRYGFLFAIGGCIGWFIFGVITGSVADIAAQCIFLILNIRGFLRWKVVAAAL